jgi:hypothetical protein
MRDSDVGECAECAHSRIVASARSRFYLCERSFTDPRYPKYPRLPVRGCPGFERRVESVQKDDES